MRKSPAKSKSRADLQREIVELKAQLANTYYYASKQLLEMGNMTASGVLVTLHALGGRELMRPVMIVDGISQDTINALLQDIHRSHTAATQFTPRLTKP